MKIAHKLTLAVMAYGLLAGEVVAMTLPPIATTSGFDIMPKPAILTDWDAYFRSKDCGMDSQGDIYYVVLSLGLFHQPKSGAAPTRITGIDSVTGQLMGMFVDPKTDSIWVGGHGGLVLAGKIVNGTVTKWDSLPIIPLLYKHYADDLGGFYKFDNILGLVKDNNGRLVAATDSLAWRLENGAWKPMGTYADYNNTYQRMLNRAVLYPPTGDIFFGTMTTNVLWAKNDSVSQLPMGSISGLSVGQFTGRVYGGDGNTANQFEYTLPPFSSSATVLIDTEQWNSGSGIFWEDASGYKWMTDGSGITLLDKKDVPVLMIIASAYNGGYNTTPNFYKFFLSPDSSAFWICSELGIFKYRQHYGLPVELTTSTLQSKREAKNWPYVIATEKGLVLNTPNSEHWNVNIFDLRGRIEFQGIVHDKTTVAIRPGFWTVQFELNGLRHSSIITVSH